MPTYRLKNLLAPRSVALVGASPRQGSVGRAILNNIGKAKFTGEFALVNSRYSEIDGIASVGSLAKLSFVPELVVITAPAKSIPGLVDEAAQRAVGFSGIVSIGDQLDVDIADLLDYFAMDEKTQAILLYIEAIKDARKFMSAARAAARIKPVVVVKSGRMAQGARAAAT